MSMGGPTHTRPDNGDWSIALLGGFEVQCGEQDVDLPSDAQRVVAFLALQNRRVPRAYIAGSLWLEGTQERAFGNLRSALWRLRRQATDLVEADNHTLGLPRNIKIDITALTEIANRIITSGSESISEGVDPTRFTMELLPGWYEEWTVVHRERLRQKYLHALEHLAERLTTRGRYATAIQTAFAAIELDPLRESPRRCLIRTHLAEGNYSEALLHYKQYREHLREELGIEPSPLLQAIVEEVTL